MKDGDIIDMWLDLRNEPFLSFGINGIKFDEDPFVVEEDVDYKLVVEPYKTDEHPVELISFDKL